MQIFDNFVALIMADVNRRENRKLKKKNKRNRYENI